MIRRPPRSTRTDTLFPYTTLFRSAGSGKTRVLTHRIAWLNEVFGVPVHGIFAVTFTNKAAGEMRHRADELLRNGSRGLWIGTFHGLAHRLLRLRSEARRVGKECVRPCRSRVSLYT